MSNCFIFCSGHVAFQLFKVGYQNSKAVNTCEDNKMSQIVPILKNYLEKLDIKPSRLVLSVLVWGEKEAYSATKMENNLRLLGKSRI